MNRMPTPEHESRLQMSLTSSPHLLSPLSGHDTGFLTSSPSPLKYLSQSPNDQNIDFFTSTMAQSHTSSFFGGEGLEGGSDTASSKSSSNANGYSSLNEVLDFSDDVPTTLTKDEEDLLRFYKRIRYPQSLEFVQHMLSKFPEGMQSPGLKQVIQDEEHLLIFYQSIGRPRDLMSVRLVLSNYPGGMQSPELQAALAGKRAVAAAPPVQITVEWLQLASAMFLSPVLYAPCIQKYLRLQKECVPPTPNVTILGQVHSNVVRQVGFTNGSPAYKMCLKNMLPLFCNTLKTSSMSFSDIYTEVAKIAGTLSLDDAKHGTACILMAPCIGNDALVRRAFMFGLTLAIFFNQNRTLPSTYTEIMLLLWVARIKMNAYTLLQSTRCETEFIWDILVSRLPLVQQVSWRTEYSTPCGSWSSLYAPIQSLFAAQTVEPKVSKK